MIGKHEITVRFFIWIGILLIDVNWQRGAYRMDTGYGTARLKQGSTRFASRLTFKFEIKFLPTTLSIPTSTIKRSEPTSTSSELPSFTPNAVLLRNKLRKSGSSGFGSWKFSKFSSIGSIRYVIAYWLSLWEWTYVLHSRQFLKGQHLSPLFQTINIFERMKASFFSIVREDRTPLISLFPA